MAKGKGTQKMGRDARTGQFIAVSEANRRQNTTVVETIKSKLPRKPKGT